MKRGSLAFVSLLFVLSCTPKPEPNYGEAGCYGAGFSGVQSYGDVGSTFGDAYYDQKMNEEVQIQWSFFTPVSATVYALYEQSPQYKNAYATPDGYILFGYYMFYYTIGNYGELAAAGVLAHEFGHRAQFTFGWEMPNPMAELEADAFSGYYMAMAKQWAWSQIEGYYANVYATGDYYFNHPQHHGTPAQRLAAAKLGVDTAIAAMNSQQFPTYDQAHASFTQTIQSEILGGVARAPAGEQALWAEAIDLDEIRDIALGLSRGTEVVYPDMPPPTEGFAP